MLNTAFVPCSVTRKLLKEAQHQVVLLANENRQLNGVRERAVMPAWSSATLGANLVEFKDTQVSPSLLLISPVCLLEEQFMHTGHLNT